MNINVNESQIAEQYNKYAEVIMSVPRNLMNSVVSKYNDSGEIDSYEDYNTVAEYFVEPYNFDESIDLELIEKSMNVDLGNEPMTSVLNKLGSSFDSEIFEFAKIIDKEGY